jgi:hypothetical protein
VNVIKTKDHLVDDMNPFYQFLNSNTKIVTQHDTIEQTTPDGSTMIASVDLNWGCVFQANLTTRLKLSFVAYMSNMITTTNTFQVYNALYQPTPEIVNKLEQQVTMLTELVESLQTSVNKFYYTSQEYEKGIEFHKGVITWLEPGVIYQTTKEFTADADETRTRKESFNKDVEDGNIIPITPLNGGD